LLVPAHSCGDADVDSVKHLLASSAPGRLDRSAPGLSNKGSHFEVIGESVLEDAAVDLIVLEDCLDVIAQGRSEVILFKFVRGLGEVAFR